MRCLSLLFSCVCHCPWAVESPAWGSSLHHWLSGGGRLSPSEGLSSIPVKLHITNFTAGSKRHHLHCFHLSRFETKMMPFLCQHWWQWRRARSHSRGKLYRKKLEVPRFFCFLCLPVQLWDENLCSADKHAGSFAHVMGGAGDNGATVLQRTLLSWILICRFLERSVWVSSVKTGVFCFKVDVLVIIPAFTCAW